MTRPGRVATITLSIAAIGAVIGAVVGAALLLVWSVPLRFLSGSAVGRSAIVGAGYGALLGGVLAPVTAWLFLRRAPLGKALLRTTIGTTIGAAIGLGVGALGVWTPMAGMIGALVGFLVAAIQLYLTTRTSAHAAGMETSKTDSGS